MDEYEIALLEAIEALKNAKTPLERSRRKVLLALLGQYRNERKKNLE